MLDNIGWVKERPVAHRGLHDLSAGAPENSLAAFERAAERGYPIELDVRLLADGQPVVFHDETLERMTDAEGRLAAIRSAEAKSLRLAGTEQIIPLLGEALDLVAGRVPVFIEIKNPDDDAGPLEAAVWEVAAACQGLYAVESFNAASMEWFRLNAPAALRGQIVSDAKDLDALMARSGARFIACRFDRLPHPAVAQRRAQGTPVLGWTTRSRKDHEQAMNHCDNVVFEHYLP